MSNADKMPGIFIAPADENLGGVLGAMDAAFRKWTDQAARGECAWVCADCCVTFPDGMPDECLHGLQGCTDIIKRDKADAKKEPSK